MAWCMLGLAQSREKSRPCFCESDSGHKFDFRTCKYFNMEGEKFAEALWYKRLHIRHPDLVHRACAEELTVLVPQTTSLLSTTISRTDFGEYGLGRLARPFKTTRCLPVAQEAESRLFVRHYSLVAHRGLLRVLLLPPWMTFSFSKLCRKPHFAPHFRPWGVLDSQRAQGSGIWGASCCQRWLSKRDRCKVACFRRRDSAAEAYAAGIAAAVVAISWRRRCIISCRCRRLVVSQLCGRTGQ